MNIESFEKWLVEEDNKATSTAYNYKTAIPYLEKHYNEIKDLNINLFDLNINDLENVVVDYGREGKYSEIGDISSGTYRNAMNALLRYKKEQPEKLDSIIQPKDILPELDKKKLSEYWVKYKEYFKKPAKEHQEKYKWNVLKQVYEKWKWNVEDKAEMFKKAFEVEGSKNLWLSGNFFPIEHTNWMFEKFRSETIEIFNTLFNEELPLTERIKAFIDFYNLKLPELQKFVPNKKLNYHSHKDLRAIGLYLSLQYPEKYFLYKHSMVKAFCEKLNIPSIKPGEKENFVKFIGIANDVLDFIKQDASFIEEYRIFTSESNNYQDDSLHLLVQDFIYTVASHFDANDVLKFKEIIEELKDLILLEDSPIENYKFRDTAPDFVWILDNDNINDVNAHYEIYKIPKTKTLTINIHFESKNKSENDFFEKNIQLPDDSEWFKWEKSRSIRLKERYDLDSENIVDELFDGLIQFEASAGELVRKAISNKSLIVNTNPENKTKMKFPLNQILYGAPGTGKTFKTKELAVEIITGNKIKDREELTKVYNELKENNQINFTTFHQSISYEDFVEGIKPVMDNIDSSNIQYEIKKGIFKEMCSTAQEKNANNFEDCYSKLIEELIGVETLELETPKGYKFSISLNRNNNLSLHTGANKLKQGTLTKENILKQLNGEDKFDGWEGYFNGVIDYLKVKYNFSIEHSKNQQQKYVLIIDEINRGNISAIFGELITLIEEDKRKGILKPNTEVLEVELPYSRDKFSVPDNLYIIGTMNTADRSVESLDTALRRRFSFVEMQPNLDVLKDEHNTNGVISIDGSMIDMIKMLEKINKRIEILIDKDHKIGHSFFINILTFEDLQLVFKDKIIPLLEEYFFGDFGKIGLVLGEHFIKNTNTDKTDIFAKFDDYEDRSLLTDKLVYEIKNPMNLGAEHFISIYE
ncbi:hypothetical protein DR871_003895 [Flavobacterium petrolei]|uniref:ATPase dynein-related AAA domain-containing protein n=1 Tax=Flavobacterium petrolei TaxID=2259594 RepID=A0A482TT18_9FLAO|nr:AAA family ATPase [Flavobacterium petrolei]RYJ53199.1 hypothetical protein DR871_003895 [Flavobacterium petrolei]